MKKREKKLQIHRETLRGLESRTLVNARGGDEWTGCLSGCTGCRTDDTYTQPVLMDAARIG